MHCPTSQSLGRPPAHDPSADPNLNRGPHGGVYSTQEVRASTGPGSFSRPIRLPPPHTGRNPLPVPFLPKKRKRRRHRNSRRRGCRCRERDRVAGFGTEEPCRGRLRWPKVLKKMKNGPVPHNGIAIEISALLPREATAGQAQAEPHNQPARRPGVTGAQRGRSPSLGGARSPTPFAFCPSLWWATDSGRRGEGNAP